MQLREALTIMEDTSRAFSIKFASFDQNRNLGISEIIELENCVQVGASHNRKKNDTTVVKQIHGERHPYTVHNHLIISVNNDRIFI